TVSLAVDSHPLAEGSRPEVRGKFLAVGDTSFYVRGVTYGAFRPDEHDREYRHLDTIDADFAHMAANGINAVRIPHTLPPRGRLAGVVRREEPDGLVTYVYYPTTEYLRLPFLDLVCFNVYLESRGRFEAYLARLHNLAGDRPLVLSELGLDSLRNGEQTQAAVLDWQVRAAFASGSAGTFVFAWTDEWYRAGEDVDDWKL